jgi:hypothetical protein
MLGRPRLLGTSDAEQSVAGDLAIAAAPWIASRALVLVALAVSRRVFDHARAFPRPIALHKGLLAWDGAFYADIARGGYDSVSSKGLRFFPLLPLMGRAVGLLPFVDPRGGVLVVANLSALVAAVLLVRLVTFETGDHALATRSAVILLLAPHAFVFVMGYAESLLCALALATFLGLRRERWWLAVVAGFAAGLCRPVGVLLVLPALVEAVRAGRRDRDRGRGRRLRVAPAIATIAPIAGLASYLLWARARTHDLWLVLRLQNDRNLRGGTVSPVTSVGHAFHELVSGDRVGYGLHAVTAIVIVVLVCVVGRRLPASYTVYAGASVLVALCARNLDSVERYALSTFPLAVGAGLLLGRPTLERFVYLLIAGGLVAAAVLAFTGALVP